LFAGREKCQYGQDTKLSIGHIITQEGVAMDSDKIAAMVQWPKPSSIKALRGFLGLIGYYKKFIQGYGSVAGPLTKLLKKDAFEWLAQANQAFDLLK